MIDPNRGIGRINAPPALARGTFSIPAGASQDASRRALSAQSRFERFTNQRRFSLYPELLAIRTVVIQRIWSHGNS